MRRAAIHLTAALAGAIQLQSPDCNPGVIAGYRLHSQVVAPGAPAPTDRRRDDGDPATGWTAAHGNPEPLPIPPGSAPEVAVTDCVDQGRYFLASSIVVDSGFETRYLSANSAAVPCGTSTPADGDGIGNLCDAFGPLRNVAPFFSDPFTVASADLDLDGDEDVVVAGGFGTTQEPGRVEWYENHAGGGTTWIERVVDRRDFTLITSISPADVDGDGDLDLFASGDRDTPLLKDGRTAWHENVASDGMNWKLRRIGTSPSARADLAVSDLDRDGDPDVLASVGGGDRVEWHENIGLPNRSPHAIAGPDGTVECQGPSGAVVTLDGSASSDPEGEPLSFTWTGPFPTITTTNPVTTVTLPRGTHLVSLEVEDPSGGISRDTVEITVDLLPSTPRTVVMTPGILWPPDHRLVEVQATGPALCAAVLRGVWSSEPDEGTGDGDRPGDILLSGSGSGSSEPGGDDFHFMLRAERSGGGAGRVYTFLYELPDIDGSALNVTAEVLVPGDRRRLRQLQGGPLPSRDRRRPPIEP